jgi:hypothetical protein
MPVPLYCGMIRVTRLSLGTLFEHLPSVSDPTFHAAKGDVDDPSFGFDLGLTYVTCRSRARARRQRNSRGTPANHKRLTTRCRHFDHSGTSSAALDSAKEKTPSKINALARQLAVREPS